MYPMIRYLGTYSDCMKYILDGFIIEDITGLLECLYKYKGSTVVKYTYQVVTLYTITAVS